MVALLLVPGRPFLESRFLRAPFDWLYSLEEEGLLTGVRTVDRVFQRRRDFLSLVVENRGNVELRDVRFDLVVAFDGGGPEERFSSCVPVQATENGRTEATLFLAAGPPYTLELQHPVFTDTEGQAWGIDGHFGFTHRGADR